MQLSARIIGQELGLTAQETNVYLQKKGFIDGEPGNYYPTEKGAKFIIEKECHRGTGGYSKYNRYWTQRTYDESILEELKDITPELKKEIREEVALRRANLAREKAELQKMYEQEQLQKKIDEVKNIKNGKLLYYDQNAKKTLTAIIIIGLTTATSFGIYKIISNRRKKAQNKEIH